VQELQSGEEPRARVNAWHICQVGTTRVTDGVDSCLEGLTYIYPIVFQDFTKGKHKWSTLQLVRFQVVKNVKGKSKPPLTNASRDFV
jgi:hypothetical protein